MKTKNLLLGILAFAGLALASTGFTSCDDDDDIPNVDLRVNVANATVVDGTIYVVEGNSFEIASITVTNNASNKAAFISAASYYWDFGFVGTNYVSPYGLKIITSDYTGLGDHILQIECPVYAVDKSPAIAYLQYNVVVVSSDSDIPSGERKSFIEDTPSLKKGKK